MLGRSLDALVEYICHDHLTSLYIIVEEYIGGHPYSSFYWICTILLVAS